MSFRALLQACVSSLLVGFSSGSTAAVEAEEVISLQRAGRTLEALQRAEAHLSSRPRDPQMRLVKALVLEQVRGRAEALAVLEALVQDFPELPEAYNNMAALHAADGDYGKARAALETALRMSPGYATAHRNLGDIHLALARQAYGTAARLAPGEADIPAKLELLDRLAGPKATAAPTSPAPSSPPAR